MSLEEGIVEIGEERFVVWDFSVVIKVIRGCVLKANRGEGKKKR